MIAFVLSRRNFRETDQIIILYTLEKGKIEVLAKGIKKIISKNSAFLEPFFLVEAEIISGKELSRLASVQPINSFNKIRTDLNKSLLAGVTVSLVERLLHENEREIKIFNMLHSWLNYLNDSKQISSVLIISFMVKMIAVLGFVPVLSHCIVCNKRFLNSTKSYNEIFFKLTAGGIVCSDCIFKINRNDEIYLPLLNNDIKVWCELLNNDWDKIPLIINDKLKQTIYKFVEYYSEKKLNMIRFNIL
ncbi:MAG: DNA repair protein RecO [Candidatus Magasanikbacteria bacterium CG10_big_fil_rev_8_21_14_0_10_36_32]|uniref:DNA repair protein RecO n=1 Tax=Candidatus Magasanikbacteria bacterium CG10_big_fil_rev_8_21_14_0_10_36_32 TaxID=1974646 RepID=A0A2M6W6N6_9BACT|nr:MAG: DNA repair protein RecO [Candidatus Magasanikbacteria bacterium CG10_big_fil_rev_8_21_14_0_10_36_32]